MASDFGEMSTRVGKFRSNLGDAYEDATKSGMDDLRLSVVQHLRHNDSVARKVTRNNIIHTDDPSVDAAIARQIYGPPWSKYLEYGTGQRAQRDTLPNHEQYKAPDPMPPYQAILDWVIAKNITPSPNGPYDSQYGLAKGIQESIGAVGTFPHPFFRPAWFGTRGYRHIVDENHDALKRELRRL